MIKKVIYKDKRDGETKEKIFQIKGRRGGSGLIIEKESEKKAIEFIKQPFVDYLGSFY